jgi:hypothetical protein
MLAKAKKVTAKLMADSIPRFVQVRQVYNSATKTLLLPRMVPANRIERHVRRVPNQ